MTTATHVVLDQAALCKICKGCHRELPLHEFTRDTARPDGRGYRCRRCEAEKQRARYRPRPRRRAAPSPRPATMAELAREFPYTLGRSWLESKALDHLLPDPHGHGHILACVDLYYPGRARGFVRDMQSKGTT